MGKDEKDGAPNRRDFLKLGAMAAPAAAATAVGSQASADEMTDDLNEGLRKTPHTEAYLASTRF